MKLSQSKISCGVRQLHDLWEDPEDNMGDLGFYLYHSTDQDWSDAAFIVWSDVVYGSGRMLYDYIVKKFPPRYGFLPYISKMGGAMNPNSDNYIDLYVWQLPANFEQWWEDNYDVDE